MLNSSIWPTDRTILCASTPGQSGPGSDGNVNVKCKIVLFQTIQFSISSLNVKCYTVLFDP